MAKISSQPKIDLVLNLSINEGEARALYAMAAYGDENFLAAFYKELGKSCLQPHSDSLCDLFAVVRSEIPNVLRQLDKARKQFSTTTKPEEAT